MSVRAFFGIKNGLFAAIAASLMLCGCAQPRAGAGEMHGGSADMPEAQRIEERPKENRQTAAQAERDEAEVATEAEVEVETEGERADPEQVERAAPRTLEPFEDIRVHLREPAVEIRAWVCIEAGFLEQIACYRGTREHESLVVMRATPSNIHAALLMAGFEPGEPGRWIFDHEAPEEKQLKLVPPRGEKLEVFVRYERDGEQIEEPIRNWVRDHHDLDRRLPDQPWIFGGSMFRENPEFMGPGEHYVADFTGSIIGLVTFGDEVIGFHEVISDQAAIHEPEWEVDIERIPPFGTEVVIVLRRAEQYHHRGTEGTETAND